MAHKSCGTTIRLFGGSCRYSSSFSGQCRYYVQTINGGYRSIVTVNGRRKILKNGSRAKDCAVFQQVGKSLIITDNVCEGCSLAFIRNIMGTNTNTCRGMLWLYRSKYLFVMCPFKGRMLHWMVKTFLAFVFGLSLGPIGYWQHKYRYVVMIAYFMYIVHIWKRFCHLSVQRLECYIQW